MKNMLLITLIISVFYLPKANAQNGYQYLNLGIGYLDKPNHGLTGSIAMEFMGKYLNSWEVYVQASKLSYAQTNSTITDSLSSKISTTIKQQTNYNYTAGLIYKHLVLRSRNTCLRIKGGLGVGSDTNSLIIETIAGFELSKTLKGGFELVLQQNNGYVFHSNQSWRSGFALGFKIPLL